MVRGTVCPLFTVKVFDPEVCPTAIVPHVIGLGEKLRTWSTPPPCPFKKSCAVFPRPSLTLIEPVIVPLATGADATLNVQLAEAARLAPQLLVC